MSEPGTDRRQRLPAWRPLPRQRPWYRKLSSQKLAETEVRTPDGSSYIVRVARNAPIMGLSAAATSGDLAGGAASLIKANLLALGDTGWTITVLKPSTTWSSERSLYRQQVGAKAILVDVIIAIPDALEHGDILWPDDEDY